jgi:hypothetical protein
MRGRLFGYLTVFFLLGLGWAISTIPGPTPCWGSESGEDPLVFSLAVQDVPLGEVLKKITKVTGYEITIDAEYAKFPITASLKNVTLHEGLRRILGKLSKYMIINDAEKEIAIRIVGPDTRGNGAGNIMGKAMSGQKKDGSINSDTQRELNSMSSVQNKVDPRDIELVPPENPGEKGLTLRELEAMKAGKPRIDPMDIELVPPENPGEKGVTLRDIEQKKSAEKGNVPENTEIVPLGDP